MILCHLRIRLVESMAWMLMLGEAPADMGPKELLKDHCHFTVVFSAE